MRTMKKTPNRCIFVGCIFVISVTLMVIRNGRKLPASMEHRDPRQNEWPLQPAAEIDGTGMSLNDINTKTKQEERPREETSRWAPFVSGLPRPVLVLAYQRTGSTYFGEVFNRDPRAFYLYEPLDAFYSSIYGTLAGWSTPTDISSYPNGTLREMPRWEAEAVSETLHNIFTCKISRLPTEFFVHKFWAMFGRLQMSAKSSMGCKGQIAARKLNCTDFLRNHCPFRLGDNWTQIDDCGRRLSSMSRNHQVGGDRSRSATRLKKQKLERDDAFHRYTQCISKQAALISPCVHHLQTACQSSDVRVVKTVRAAMSEMDMLFRTLPNFRLVHLIRDPRGVVNSRGKYPGCHGFGDPYNAVAEARIYCRNALRDIEERSILEARYPGRIINVIYDDLVKSPVDGFRQIHEFLNLTAPPDVMSFIHSTKASSAASWTKSKTLTREIVRGVDVVCQELYDVVSNTWPH